MALKSNQLDDSPTSAFRLSASDMHPGSRSCNLQVRPLRPVLEGNHVYDVCNTQKHQQEGRLYFMRATAQAETSHEPQKHSLCPRLTRNFDESQYPNDFLVSLLHAIPSLLQVAVDIEQILTLPHICPSFLRETLAGFQRKMEGTTSICLSSLEK